MDKKQTWNMGYWVFALVLLFLLQDVWQSANQIQTVPYSEFEKALADGRISDITLTDRTISGHLKAPANGKTLMAAALVEPALAERLNLSLGDGNDEAKALNIQPDGKLVVDGTTVNAGSSNMAVARFNTDGSLDTTFGTSNDGTPDGVVSLSLGNGDDVAHALAIQADGKIVMVGSTSSTGSTSNAVVVRLNADGSLDASFGQSDDGTPNGVVNLSVGDGNDFGKTVILQADGKILLAGDLTNGTSSDIWVARLMAN